MEIEPSPLFGDQNPTVNSHLGALLFHYQAAPLGHLSCYCRPHALQKCAAL